MCDLNSGVFPFVCHMFTLCKIELGKIWIAQLRRVIENSSWPHPLWKPLAEMGGLGPQLGPSLSQNECSFVSFLKTEDKKRPNFVFFLQLFCFGNFGLSTPWLLQFSVCARLVLQLD